MIKNFSMVKLVPTNCRDKFEYHVIFKTRTSSLQENEYRRLPRFSFPKRLQRQYLISDHHMLWVSEYVKPQYMVVILRLECVSILPVHYCWFI